VRHDVLGLPGGVGGIDVHRHRPDVQGGQIGDGALGLVGRKDAHHFAFGDAKVQQPSGGLLHPLAEPIPVDFDPFPLPTGAQNRSGAKLADILVHDGGEIFNVGDGQGGGRGGVHSGGSVFLVQR
jgi:hypothetical protein